MMFEGAPECGRDDNFKKVLELMYSRIREDRKFVILETGTAFDTCKSAWYNDGYSTRIFGWFAQKYNGILYTIDNNPQHIETGKKITEKYKSCINYITGDSTKTLHNISVLVDLMYFDSAMNPDLALEECKIIYPMFHKNTVVLFDDTYGVHNNKGKGYKAIKYMLEQSNWEIERLPVNQAMLYQN